MAKKGNFKVPFLGGNQLRHAWGGWWRSDSDKIEWRENTPFYANMHIGCYHRYNHSCYIELSDGHEHTYYMNFKRFFLEIKWAEQNGRPLILEGWWRFEKIGETYGVRRVDRDELNEYYDVLEAMIRAEETMILNAD